MDLDTNDLDRYLANVGGYADIAATAPASRPAMDSTIPVSEETLRVGAIAPNGGSRIGAEDSPMSGPEMVGAADMDSIVAENMRELRRRSLANPGGSFGIDYLSVGDDVGGPYSMVSPTFSDASMSAGLSQMAGIPTTMEELMASMGAPTASDLNMMYGGDADGGMPGDISSIFAEASPMLPSSAHQNTNPLSLPPSPLTQSVPGGLRPTPQLSRGNSNMSAVSMSDSAMPMTMNTNRRIDVVPSAEPTSQPVPSIFPENIYSSSGFDMLDILNRVANRENPQINIGAVDMSCAFVVTDVRKFDNPIVYCSATFERLTGYTKHEVLGRNCRFLQAPDGKITPGEKRKYVDENAVYYLKTRIAEKLEGQTSLINYRKGGQSFTNLLTMIPIKYDSPDIVYIVGFQVDLVDQPGAMMNKNRGMSSPTTSLCNNQFKWADRLGKDGTFAVNYQYAQLPTYIPTAATMMMMDERPRVMMGRDDVSQVLASFGTGDSELHSKRVMDKVLLENTDDVVHVLSLKGLFLYCSPSIRKVLEYEPQELVGTSLSGVCHPSDIVPVTRDLKDTSTGVTVNVVFRIRRKFSGYTWFESHGCLHTEQGKGRKCIILVGRERPVYVLRWKQIQAGGGIGENEVWTKMSTSGMFLFVSSNTKMLLDRESEEMMGTSIQDLMRMDSKQELGKALESARQGNKTTVRHEIQNKRGQFLQAVTTLFPGDGGQYQRPTFLIAQTKLLKHMRASASQPPQSPAGIKAPPTASQTPSSHGSTPTMWSASGGTPSTRPTTEERSTSAESKDSDGSNSNADDNMFEELKTTRSTSWQFELRQMQRTNKRLVEELAALLASRKKRKRRKGVDQLEKDCANCHTRVTPEWRRGPSGKRDLCNSCGLRYAKLQKIGRGSSRTAPSTSDKGGGGSPLAQTSQSIPVEASPGQTSTMLSSQSQKPSQLATIQEPRQSSVQQAQQQAQQTQQRTEFNIKPSMPMAGSNQPPIQPLQQQGRRGSMGNGPRMSLMKQQQQARRRSMGGVVPSPQSTSSSSSLTPKQPSLQYNSGPSPMDEDTEDGGPGG